MTCSLATRYRRDRAPRYPLACSMISRRFLRPWTARFTRGMSESLPSSAQEPAGHLRLGTEGCVALDPPAPAAGLLGQLVVAGCLAMHDLAGPGDSEPLDLDPSLALPGFLLLHRSLVLELAVVHDPAHGRLGLRGDLDEVQIELLGLAKGFLDPHDSDLRSVRADQAHLGSPDPVVHTWLDRDATSPPAMADRRRRGRSRKKIDRHPLILEYREWHRQRASTGPAPG